MKVLVGMECSGVVRQAFRDRGHNAWSCDLKPPEDGSLFHFQDDIRNVIDYTNWDLGIFHPDCTYLTVSAAWAYKDPDFDRYPGVGYHQRVKPGTLTGAERRKAREEAIGMIVFLMGCGFTYCIENPAKSFISTMVRPADQVIQPYEYGHDASKATGLWFNDQVDIEKYGIPRLPPLKPTSFVAPRFVDSKPRWGNQTDSGQNRLTPNDERATDRARTYQGWADAMVRQWGNLK